MAWMAWEQLWDKAAVKADIHLLAQLVGMQVDTPEKHGAAERVFRYYAEQPQHYDGKLMRLLLTHGAKVPPSMVAPLCQCGVRAMKLMEDHGVDLKATNIAGENALSLVCLMGDAEHFKKSWLYLRERGLDPEARDDCLETAMDAVEKYGKEALVEQVETQLLAQAQAKSLDATTPASKAKRRKSRL